MSYPEDQSGKNSEVPFQRACRPLSRLVLTGFMGAGKSSVGALAAQELGWRFVDLDGVIEAMAGKTIPEIFRAAGEAHFREQERRALEVTGRQKEIVLALGGGTIEDPDTLAYVLEWKETCMVFLDAPLPELLARIRGSRHKRPLLGQPEALLERHQRRLPHYRAAHVTVATGGLDQTEVCARLLQAVRSWQVEERASDGNLDGKP